jgi:hypothetical protein
MKVIIRNALIIQNVSPSNKYKQLTLCAPIIYPENHHLIESVDIAKHIPIVADGFHYYIELHLTKALKTIENIDLTCRYKFEVNYNDGQDVSKVTISKIEEDDDTQGEDVFIDNDQAHPSVEDMVSIKNSLIESIDEKLPCLLKKIDIMKNHTNRLVMRVALLQDSKNRCQNKYITWREIDNMHRELEMLP